MTMDRDHGLDRENGSLDEDGRSVVPASTMRPSVEHVPHDQAMHTARRIMAKYHGVLRELAK